MKKKKKVKKRKKSTKNRKKTKKIGGGTQTCAQTSLSTGQSTTCTDADGASGCSAEGDAFSYKVSIAYTIDSTGATHTFSGDGKKIKGKCAT